MARPALLVDAGALIAVVNNRDQYHSSISKTLAGFFGELLTTWPAIAEACHILPVHLGPALLGWLSTSRSRTNFEIYRTKTKSVGEACLSPVPASIGNALKRATGVRLFKLPFTPERILRGMLNIVDESSTHQGGQS